MSPLTPPRRMTSWRAQKSRQHRLGVCVKRRVEPEKSMPRNSKCDSVRCMSRIAKPSSESSSTS
eukprot:13233045-Heterocapsa_arctica.AAC.1